LILGHLALSSTDDLKAPQACFEQAEALFEIVDNPHGIASALSGHARIANKANDLATSELFAAQGLALFRQSGDEERISTLLHNLAESVRYRGDYARARTGYEESAALGQKLHRAKDHLAHNRQGLGYVALRQGDYDEARACFQESTRLLIAQGLRYRVFAVGMAVNLAGLGGVAMAEGLPAKAVRLFGAADTHANRERLDPVDQLELDRDIAAARAQLDAVAFDQAWAEGQAMTLEHSLAVALGDDVSERAATA